MFVFVFFEVCEDPVKNEKFQRLGDHEMMSQDLCEFSCSLGIVYCTKSYRIDSKSSSSVSLEISKETAQAAE